ncbi:hypothetical protein JI721_06720 [Alicyclobacillus cycloheptanicus]|uniref:Uncharacterized protein n=1 Tax=Alicyclobacillus cycloheptanicus TaxID=1457 RepID=A0ABT9XHR6_9BACL|nr:hypothetical protein [Alicyclobacillus cycloheptanicus]MDQ0189852.1 hypothetical protein [Alicyclobacillus cycloheptanicus]WDM02464.1 hypothetical protein JI721_06720 [Alicyclobacillus cycloheptanicus]
MRDDIPKSVQDAVDQYIEVYRVYKQLEERMQEMRNIIEPYMKANDVQVISDRQHSGKIHLTVQERAKVTSRYTLYDVDALSQLLDSTMMKKCLVEVVDKEKVEALCKMGELPEEVSTCRSVSPTYSFSVRLTK